MASPPAHFPGPVSSLRPSSNRPVRDSREHPTSAVPLSISTPSSSRCRRPSGSMAFGPSVRFSPDGPPSQGHPQNSIRASGSDTCGTALASEALVCGPSVPIGDPIVAHTPLGQYSLAGRSNTSRPGLAQSDRLEIERCTLKAAHVPADVVHTLLSSRRPSTERIYSATWRIFCNWCSQVDVIPLQPSIIHILMFLQKGLSQGLSHNTLHRQIAALSSVLTCGSLSSLAQHPLIRRFLRGAKNLCPPVLHRYPTWDLPLVLQSLTGPPYEPLQTASLRLLTCKVAFLVAITSARRISELAALSTRPDLCVFHTDRVVLRLDPTFVPKINSVFHRAQELILPNFCPRPSHPRERRWHALDVRRALRIYLKRTAPFRRSESLFVSFLPTSQGGKVSSSTIGRWIRQTIAAAYDSRSLPRPSRLTAHSTRSASTTAAWATQAPLLEICRAATWSSPSPFIRHYKLDQFASAEASFGRRVLQRVVAGEDNAVQHDPPLITGQ
ncbi:endonuclease/exonuclease/phosphatase family domain-containing protein 1 isoform X6 [Pantherophis guttatus]|uniref:Endonuclease/exonuclease/phosphatase family domain-containing protein 1 isoform X6 n=1 Tax=Pantherophis guttatus TaxID=94885 RepID=A0ABM3Z157_PANGU|nr:endonuclease/exonuclease/phosphatase family domain-containing protein 1 isoform X6 [Pantherophis guttatus]